METVNNILISRLRFMGDIILTTPLLHELKRTYPQASITYLAEEPYISLLRHHPHIYRLLSFKRSDKGSQNRAMFKLLTNKYDIAIDLFGNPRSAYLTWLSGAKIRIGGNFRGRKHFYSHKIKDDGKTRSAVDFHLRYLSPLDIKPHEPVDPYIIVHPDEKEWAAKYLDQKGFDLDKKIIGIHAGATWPAKRWSPERFSELATRLTAEADAQILFTMGPGEHHLVQSVIKNYRYDAIAPEVLSLRKLAAILYHINVFVSNDCGPMHLAPAVGTPTVGIFGPGEPEIWFPYSPNNGHRLVFHQIDCSRCHRDLCPKMECMQSITSDMVFKAVMDTINSKTNLR